MKIPHKPRHHLKNVQRKVRNKLGIKPAVIVLFDHFGVVSTDPLAQWKAEHQLSAEQIEYVAQLCYRIDSGELDLWPFYTELGKLTVQSAEEVKAELDRNVIYNRELLDIVRQLRATGHVRVGLLSNAHRSLHIGLWQDGVHSYFDDVLTSQEVSKVKPKPDAEFFYHAINRLGGKPEQTIFFDDRMVNIEGARAAGIKAHLFTTAAKCKVELHKHKAFS